MLADGEQPEAKLVAPVAPPRREVEGLEQGLDRRGACRKPGHVPAERMEAPAHVEDIGRSGLHEAQGREGLEPVLALERDGRRVVDDAVSRLEAAQRRGLAVTDLHEARLATAQDVLGRGHRDPIAAHDALGAKTRRRWPSGSMATNVWQKSMSAGAWKMVRPRPRQSACIARTVSALATAKASSPPPPVTVAAGSTVCFDQSPSFPPDDRMNMAKVGEDSTGGRPISSV